MAVEFTVGRHAAHDGAGVDPLVAAALEARMAHGPSTHRHDRPAVADSTSEGEGLGWPGSPRDGSGLGWPGDGSAQAAPVEAPGPWRSGWRRLFGGAGKARPSAEQAPQGSTAA